MLFQRHLDPDNIKTAFAELKYTKMATINTNSLYFEFELTFDGGLSAVCENI